MLFLTLSLNIVAVDLEVVLKFILKVFLKVLDVVVDVALKVLLLVVLNVVLDCPVVELMVVLVVWWSWCNVIFMSNPTSTSVKVK